MMLEGKTSLILINAHKTILSKICLDHCANKIMSDSPWLVDFAVVQN